MGQGNGWSILGRRYVPRHIAPAARGGGIGRKVGAGALVAALAAGGISAGQIAAAPGAQAAQGDIVQVSAAKRTGDMQRMLTLINQYRASLGLNPVKFSNQLSGIVQEHSNRQVAEERFYHSSSFMTDARAGQWTHTNEIIALSYQDSVDQLVSWWKTSPAHNAALTSPKAQVIGIGLTYADGSLQNTGQAWRILSTVNLYGYANGGAPADTSATVNGTPSGGTGQAPSGNTGLAPSGNTTGYTLRGAIGSRYFSDGGSAFFGQPIMNEAPATGGGQYQIFDKAGKRTKMIWSPATGAHAIREFGAIGFEWSIRGYERGYGYPLTSEYQVGNEMRQDFANGYTITWNMNNGALRVLRW